MTEMRAYGPTTVSPPGETLADLLDERGLTQAELATRLNRPAKTINEIIRGVAAITPETAIQLEQALSTPAAFWLAREAHYREYLARVDDEAKIVGPGKAWLTEIGFAQLVKLGWVADVKGVVARVRAALRFFGVASIEAWQATYAAPITTATAFRKSTRFATEMGPLAGWLRRGEVEANAIQTKPYVEADFKACVNSLRALTKERNPAVFVPNLRDSCAAAGVAVVLVPAPAGCRASGATRWLSPTKAIIQLSLRHKTNDHLWFTFFHEAGHILLHGKRRRFIDIEGDDRQDSAEREADGFARDLLIPPASAAPLRNIQRSEAAVRAFAAEIDVAPGIVVGRMQHERLLPWSHLNDLKVKYEWKRES